MIRRLLSLLILFLFLISCTQNKITGRSQFKLLPESELQSMDTSQYQQFLASNKVVNRSSSRDAEMVNRVGPRIVKAVTDYYALKGLSKELEGYRWEYNLVDS